MAEYIMALDAGTTSCRAVVFDRRGEVCAVGQREFPQHFPKPGWVEHDADEIWDAQLASTRKALAGAGLHAADIAAIGITNQRETTVLWDRATGRPAAPAIVWQCRRTAEYCDELIKRGLGPMIRAKTGLLPDAYFSATKLKWLLDNTPGARAAAVSGRLAFGTVESYLLWKLSGGKLHLTDHTNASRTMLFNINTLKWDDELLELFGIPPSLLPSPVPCAARYGETASGLFDGAVALAGAAGDQQAALFAQGCLTPGQAKVTYGTGGFLLMNTGNRPVVSGHGLLTTLACGPGGRPGYALEGSVFVAGAAIQWLRDQMKLVESSPDSERIAREVPDTNGCYMVPAFTGLGAPHWEPHARGVIVGLTRGVTRAHLVRAALEALAYQVDDVIEAMRDDSSLPLDAIKVDGGASLNNFLMQFQADVTRAAVRRACNVEATALGAACLAGIAVGFWPGEPPYLRGSEREFVPAMAAAEREEKLRGWRRAVRCARAWARDID